MAPRLTTLAAVLGLLAVPSAASAAPAATSRPKARTALTLKVNRGPLPPGQTAAIVHAPFGAGDCESCHKTNDPKNPGPVTKAGNEVCNQCHEEFSDIMKRPYKHPPSAACVNCHNAHDSRQPKLLHADISALCNDCHTAIKAIAESSKVKHGALETGQKCASCHNPHAGNIEKLLIQLPFDLCVNCHAVDDMKDHAGVVLTNYKKWLDENKIWHAPVAAKDCSACHRTHGGDNFRLLVAEYPSKFYAPFESRNYALCFGCHNEKVVLAAQTTTLTNFRDGSRNLHHLHVNKERGRTCRACHEVHAGNQAHHIRDGVPYGPRGWILKIGFTKTPTGGQCAKTCHDTKSYTNRTASTAGPGKN